MDISTLIKEDPIMWLILGYIVVINVVSYLMFWTDKTYAQNKQWRISDRKFVAQAWMGGSLGCLLGLRLARNKNRRKVFTGRIVGIFIFQIILAVILLHPALRAISIELIRNLKA